MCLRVISDQMMENPLFLLKSVSTTRLSTSSASWAMDMILAFLCGLVLFILLIPFLQTNSSFPLTGEKKKIGKHHTEKKQNKSPKSCLLKACRECRKEVEETRDLALFLQSHLYKLCGNGRFSQLSHGDAPGEMFKPGLARPKQLSTHRVDDPSSSSLSSLLSLPSGTQHPLASTLCIEPQEDQPDLMSVSPTIAPQNSRLSNSYLASLITALSSSDLLHYCLSFFSRWWATAKATFFSAWAHGKSQQEHLPYHAPDTVFWAIPTPWQVDPRRRDHSFIHPDVQKLLEMLISKRVKEKMCQEKQKDGSFFQPVNTDYPQVSLRNLLRSLGDTLTSAQPFCHTQGQPEWLLGSQQLSFHRVLGGHLEHECSQLFWGLPSLHSESLVATASVTTRSSPTQPRCIKFNQFPSRVSGQSEDEGPPQNLPPFLPYVQPPAQLPCFPPYPKPTSPSQVRACRTTCPTSQQKAQAFVPMENENLEWPLQTPLKWRKALTSKLQKAREGINLPTLNLLQGSQASEDPESASLLSGDSNSDELQEKPECHRPGGFFRKEGTENLPHPAFRFLASQDLEKPLGKLPRTCQGQARENRRPSQPSQCSVPASASRKAVQETKSWCSDSLFNKGLVTLKLEDRRNVLQGAKKKRKDASQSIGSTTPEVQGHKKDAESDIMWPEKHDLDSHFSRGPDQKDLRKGLQVHLSRKLGQIKEGMIPVCVRKSWLAAKHTLADSNTPTQPAKVTFPKGRKMCVNTSQEFAFLDPRSRLFLEAHMRKHRLRYNLGLLLEDLEHRNIHFGEAQAVPRPQPACVSTASCDSRADFTAELAIFQPKIPRTVQGQKTTHVSSPTLQSPLPATRSPAHKAAQRVRSGTPSDHNRGPSEVPPTVQEAGLPSAACIQQSRTILVTQRGSLVHTPGPEMAKHDPGEGSGRAAFGGTCHSNFPVLEVQAVSSHSVTKESREPAVEERPAWEVNVGAGMMENSPIIDIKLKSLGSRDTSNHSSPSREILFPRIRLLM